MSRIALIVLLLAVLSVNTYSGIAKIMGFAYGNRGARELATADFDPALSNLQRSLRWLPDESTYHVTIGRVVAGAQANGIRLATLEGLSDIEVFALGASAVARGIALNPADAWGWFNLGVVYDGYGDSRIRLERMLQAGRAAAGDGPAQTVTPPGRRGLSAEDRFVAASAEMAREMEPDFFFYGEFLADLFWGRGQIDRATAELRDSFALMPRVELHSLIEEDGVVDVMGDAILEGIDQSAANPYLSPGRAARARADILKKLGRNEEAIESWEELSRLGGESYRGEADLETGRLLQRLERYRESIPYLTEALEAGDDKVSGALYYLGTAHSKLGDHETAVTYYRQAIAQRESSLGGYLGLASELILLGQSDEAERTYIDAVRRFPEHKVTYELLIKHMITNGREKEAEPYAEALTKKDPGNKTALALLAKLKRGPLE